MYHNYEFLNTNNLHMTNIKERNDDIMLVKRPVRCGNWQKVNLDVNRDITLGIDCLQSSLTACHRLRNNVATFSRDYRSNWCVLTRTLNYPALIPRNFLVSVQTIQSLSVCRQYSETSWLVWRASWSNILSYRNMHGNLLSIIDVDAICQQYTARQ